MSSLGWALIQYDWCLYSHTRDWDTNKLKEKVM